ncbi:MAG: hypothetical protein GX375_05075 [Clostridiales bacterium]|nr:hypothetical protein [Clostridiales bacterium]
MGKIERYVTTLKQLIKEMQIDSNKDDYRKIMGISQELDKAISEFIIELTTITERSKKTSNDKS